MLIELNNVRARLVTTSPAELSWASDYLTYDDARARYARGTGDGRTSLLSQFDQSFPAGFAPAMMRAAREAGWPVIVEDQRQRPCEPDSAADLAWLRDYQREAVDRCLASTRGIVWIPTGGGKTEVAAGVVKALRCSWLFIVPQADLLYQTGERFEKRTGEEWGVIGDGEWREARFTVATFQTLASAIAGRSSAVKQRAAADLLGRVEGLIVDECHTAPADTILAVLSKTRAAYWRFGLSGTPLARTDGRSLRAIGALGGIIHRIKPETLIAAGALSRPTIRVVPVVQATSRPTWQGAHGDLVVRSKQRNATIANICKAAQAPGFVFVSHVKHGKTLTKLLTDAGLRVEFVWGVHSTDIRSRVIERLVTGKLDFVVCSSVFQQAIDVPQLRSVINAAGGASAIATIQRIGRGTRVTADKTTFEAWDIVDRGNRWLERHSRERLRAYEGEGYQVTLAPEYSAPNDAGLIPDPDSVNAEAEYRKAQKVTRDALQALTGQTSVRRRR